MKPRTSDQQKLAAVYAAIRQTNDPVVSVSRASKKKRCELLFPWWCIFVAYALSLIMVGVSILFIIARGIEFGDVKTQKWLVSLIIGLVSSIFITQPLKVRHHFFLHCSRISMCHFDLQVFCLAVLFAFCCRSRNNDQEMAGHLDNDDDTDLVTDDDPAHLVEVRSLSSISYFPHDILHIAGQFTIH